MFAKSIIFVLLLSSCSGAAAPPSHEIPADAFQTINVYFNRDSSDCSSVVALERQVPKIKDIEIIALKNLFRGPAEEGYNSFFSSATADILLSFHGKDGRAYVDLADIRAIIPNASSSCGSAMLLSQMDATIKQFGTYSKTLYAINGSSEDFYEWLQMEAPESFPDQF